MIGSVIEVEIKCPKCGYINKLGLDKTSKHLYSGKNKGIERFDRQP